jgi:hypothetical protein
VATAQLRGRAALAVYGGTVLALGGAIAFTIALGPTLVRWAHDVPGGPTAFLIALGSGSALALLIASVGCLVHVEPTRAPGWLHLSARVRLTGTALAGLAAMLLMVVFASALPGRGGENQCDGRADLGCALQADGSSAPLLGGAVWLSVMIIGSTALYLWWHRPAAREVPGPDA